MAEFPLFPTLVSNYISHQIIWSSSKILIHLFQEQVVFKGIIKNGDNENVYSIKEIGDLVHFIFRILIELLATCRALWK